MKKQLNSSKVVFVMLNLIDGEFVSLDSVVLVLIMVLTWSVLD